jgi:hypothetical protein
VSEPLDLVTISGIRDEGLKRSHVMEYGGGRADGIGSRLTGSPEFERGAQWAIGQLRTMGGSDAHEESWGEFGMVWTQLRTTLLLDTPAPATLVAQATPWSPSTKGEISAPVALLPEITTEAQLSEYMGKLRGKVVLYGRPPAINPSPKPPLVAIDDASFKARMEYPLEAPVTSQEQDLKAAQSRRMLGRVEPVRDLGFDNVSVLYRRVSTCSGLRRRSCRDFSSCRTCGTMTRARTTPILIVMNGFRKLI